jgi:hypothetical protein
MNFAYLFTSLDGRINRKPYWLAALLLFAVSIAVQLGVYFASNMQVMMIVGLIFMWPSFALAVKRAHDRNRPIWLVALFFLILLATTFMQIAGVTNRRTVSQPAYSPRFRSYSSFSRSTPLLTGASSPARRGRTNTARIRASNKIAPETE